MRVVAIGPKVSDVPEAVYDVEKLLHPERPPAVSSAKSMVASVEAFSFPSFVSDHDVPARSDGLAEAEGPGAPELHAAATETMAAATMTRPRVPRTSGIGDLLRCARPPIAVEFDQRLRGRAIVPAPIASGAQCREFPNLSPVPTASPTSGRSCCHS